MPVTAPSLKRVVRLSECTLQRSIMETLYSLCNTWLHYACITNLREEKEIKSWIWYVSSESFHTLMETYLAVYDYWFVRQHHQIIAILCHLMYSAMNSIPVVLFLDCTLSWFLISPCQSILPRHLLLMNTWIQGLSSSNHCTKFLEFLDFVCDC